MPGKLKKSTVRKILKTATMRLWIEESRVTATIRAALEISEAPDSSKGIGPDLFLRITGQANDLSRPDPYGSTGLPPAGLPPAGLPPAGDVAYPVIADATGFYAIQVACIESFNWRISEYESPDRARCVRELVESVAKARNLNAVYRDCGLSVVISALEHLGVSKDPTGFTLMVGNRDPQGAIDWRRAREIQKRERELEPDNYKRSLEATASGNT